jgi:pimeloyl-ACP methyl ester carboxylesterase
MASDAVTLLDELGVEQAHLAGVSLGGMVAQEVALGFPERVARLVLASTTGGFRSPDQIPTKGLRRLLEATFRSLRPGSDPEHQVSAFLRMAASEDFAAQCRPGDEAWACIAAMLQDPASQRGSALQLLAAMRHSSWSRLDQLRMPVQIHHGLEDALIPFAAGRELKRRIPGARLDIHPGTGHGLLERTEEVTATNIAFYAEHEEEVL